MGILNSEAFCDILMSMKMIDSSEGNDTPRRLTRRQVLNYIEVAVAGAAGFAALSDGIHAFGTWYAAISGTDGSIFSPDAEPIPKKILQVEDIEGQWIPFANVASSMQVAIPSPSEGPQNETAQKRPDLAKLVTLSSAISRTNEKVIQIAIPYTLLAQIPFSYISFDTDDFGGVAVFDWSIDMTTVVQVLSSQKASSDNNPCLSIFLMGSNVMDTYAQKEGAQSGFYNVAGTDAPSPMTDHTLKITFHQANTYLSQSDPGLHVDASSSVPSAQIVLSYSE